MGLWTTGGLTQIATAVQQTSGLCTLLYVSISTGCGTISAGISSGVPITSITLDANVPVTLSSSQSLTITDGTNSETVTTSGSVTGGTTPTIPINSWTPAHTYAAHVTGVCPTPAAGDTALYNESYRVAANIGTAGVSAGESLNSGYFDGTQATGVYLMVGYWSGYSATSSLGTGILMGEDVQFWNHVINNDSNMYQADSFI